LRARAGDLRQRIERRAPRVASPRPAAIARPKRAGSLFGARPSSLTRTISATARRPSVRMQRSTAVAFSRVGVHSDA
jgi:hypothetical protein